MNIIFKPECKTEIIEPTYDLPIIGEPISKTGASANNSNAYGVIVGIIGDGSSRKVRVMTEGYIDYDKVKENYMEYTDEAINALTGITLCSGGKLPTGGGSGGDVWEFGGTIPLDLTTPTAIYEFAPCSIWKKVRIVRVRSSYNADLKSNVWYGASNCDNDGIIVNLNVLYTSNGYVYHYIEMMTDDDGGIVGTSAESNNTTSPMGLSSSAYLNNRVASNIPTTYEPRSLTKDSNWEFYAVDPSAAWDGNETYYWWGVRA